MIVAELRHDFRLEDLLSVAGLARSTFYYHVAAAKKPEEHDVALKIAVQRAYDRHRGRYGYRRVTAELRSIGSAVNHKRVQRIMGELNLRSIARVKQYRAFRGAESVNAANLLNRQFTAHRPNQKWVTDVTQFRINNEKLYLSPVVDLFNGEVISYDVSRRPLFAMVQRMVDRAVSRLRPGEQPILHSDQGWQYRMPVYAKALVGSGLRMSMSRKGNCYDNAPAESFFGALKAEFYHPNKFETVEALAAGLASYIDYYNNDRIKLRLGGLSPVQYRQKFA